MTYFIETGSGYWFDGTDGAFTWAETDDRAYYCSHACMTDDLPDGAAVDAHMRAEIEPLRYTDGRPTDRYPAITWGSMSVETDSDVYCASCETLIAEGLQTASDREAFIETAFPSYVACALWSSVILSGSDSCPTPAYSAAGYSADDLHPSAVDYLMTDLRSFVESEWSMAKDLDAGQVGHDLWLTQNRHGAGFWDRGHAEPIGQALTDAAHVYGSTDLYVGDDGSIYAA